MARGPFLVLLALAAAALAAACRSGAAHTPAAATPLSERGSGRLAEDARGYGNGNCLPRMNTVDSTDEHG